MVERVDVVEQWRRSCAQTLWKGSIDSRTKPASTCVEREYKRRIDETTRTLGAHRETIRSRKTTDGEDTIGYDSKVLIRKEPAKDTGRNQRRTTDTDLRMAVDDLRDNYVAEES